MQVQGMEMPVTFMRKESIRSHPKHFSEKATAYSKPGRELELPSYRHCSMPASILIKIEKQKFHLILAISEHPPPTIHSNSEIKAQNRNSSAVDQLNNTCIAEKIVDPELEITPTKHTIFC